MRQDLEAGRKIVAKALAKEQAILTAVGRIIAPEVRRLAADAQAESAKMKADWQATYGEPYPADVEDWYRWAARLGMSADAILKGDWNPADVQLLIEGRLLALKDKTKSEPATAPPAREGPPARKPLTETHQAAYDLICEASKRGEGLTGPQICRRLGIDSESNFTAHYVPELKRFGILNRRGLGYYHPEHYKPAPTLGGKR